MRSSWICLTAISIIVLPFLFATELHVLNEFSPRVAENMISCPCSPTQRGYSKLHNFTNAVRNYNKAIRHVKNPFVLAMLDKYHIQVTRSFSLCVAQFGFEACVNMDAELRKSQHCAVQVCIFDMQTGQNLERRPSLGGFRFVPPCNDDTKFRSEMKSEYLPGFRALPSYHASQRVSFSPASQHDSARNTDENIERTKGVPIAEHDNTSSEETHVLIRLSPTPLHSQQVSVNAVATIHSHSETMIYESNIPFHRGKMSHSSEPVKTKNVHEKTHAGNVSPGIPWPSRIVLSPGRERIHPQASQSDARISEGCIAVEHLKGYALQHKKNLLRGVLCSKGFCATPHHAIIVDGKMTSMNRLCRVWECVNERKMVNNLNVFVNRRASVGDIVVTPYDIRFPRCFVWFAQAFTSVFH